MKHQKLKEKIENEKKEAEVKAKSAADQKEISDSKSSAPG